MCRYLPKAISNSAIAPSFPPDAQHSPCRCRRDCKGFRSVPFYPSHDSSCIAFSKKQVGIRYIKRICFWQLCPAYIFRDISATLPSGMKQNVLSGFGLILFPASPEFSAISPERDKSQYSAKSTFSNFTLQRSKNSNSGNGMSGEISANFCS